MPGSFARDVGDDAPLRFTELPGQLRIAVGLVAAQSVALVGFAVFLAVKVVVSHPNSVGGGLVEALLALIGGAVFGLGARGLAAGSVSARTPVVVIEVLALPVSFDLGFQAGLIGLGAPILIVALAVLYLLFTPPVRQVLDREI